LIWRLIPEAKLCAGVEEWPEYIYCRRLVE